MFDLYNCLKDPEEHLIDNLQETKWNQALIVKQSRYGKSRVWGSICLEAALNYQIDIRCHLLRTS